MQTQRTFKLLRSAAQGILALCCAVFWQTSAAQLAQAPHADATSDPSANVPAVNYRSVFKETSLGVEKDSTDWRKANDEVGKFIRGHIDILKWEEQENAKAMPKPTMPAKPGTTKPIAAPAHKH